MIRIPKNTKHRLKQKYGLSLQEYQVILSEQNDRCAICGEKTKKMLAVDHNHDTGIIRGLLCCKCNLGIGYFDDNPNILWQAIQYLMPDFEDL